MVDYSGIVYRLIRAGGELILLLTAAGIACCLKREGRKKLMIASLLLAVLLAVPIVHYSLALYRPQVEMIVGEYAGSSKSFVAARGIRNYSFDTGDYDLPTYRLGHLAAGKILADGLKEGMRYCVWYEARTEVILKCVQIAELE